MAAVEQAAPRLRGGGRRGSGARLHRALVGLMQFKYVPDINK